MSFDDLHLPANPTTRRDVFRIGGLTIGLGALVAACGEYRGGDSAPGRVGNAPIVTDLPEYQVDDAVLLRTASSLEYTTIDVYETLRDLGGLIPEDLVPLVDRLIDDHRATADKMTELTKLVGGEPWTCTNPWLMDRLVQPTLESIQANIVGVVQADTSMVQVLSEVLPIGDVVTTSQGDIGLISSADGLSEGDEIEFTRLEGAAQADTLTFATALEGLGAAAHQELVSAVELVIARTAHLEAATLESRHSAVLAIAADGAAAYISPALLGEDVAPDARGQFRQFAIASQFGETSQIEIKAGPADLNNVRTSVILQTPAANSFVYNELSCDA